MSTIIGIQLYSLNIARSFNSLDLIAVNASVPDKYRAHYLVLFEEVIADTDSTALLAAFDFFWQRQFLNVLLIYWTTAVRLNVTSYSPFLPVKSIFFDEYETDYRILFPDKVQNMNRFPLRGTVFYDETRARFNRFDLDDLEALDGADGSMAKLFSDFMNASLIISMPPDGEEIGEYLPDGRATGCLGQLVRGEVDFGVNVRFYRLSQFGTTVEASADNGRDDICILVCCNFVESDFSVKMDFCVYDFRFPDWVKPPTLQTYFERSLTTHGSDSSSQCHFMRLSARFCCRSSNSR